MDPESLYVQLGRLAETIPDLTARPMIVSTREWLGRACALVDAVGATLDSAELRLAIKKLSGQTTYYGSVHDAAEEIVTILYRALAIAELNAPDSAKGAFIPARNAFDALAAVAKTLSGATEDVLIVDPYMDEKILTDFRAIGARRRSDSAFGRSAGS